MVVEITVFFYLKNWFQNLKLITPLEGKMLLPLGESAE